MRSTISHEEETMERRYLVTATQGSVLLREFEIEATTADEACAMVERELAGEWDADSITAEELMRRCPDCGRRGEKEGRRQDCEYLCLTPHAGQGVSRVLYDGPVSGADAPEQPERPQDDYGQDEADGAACRAIATALRSVRP
jgi:hypothetical protein